MLILFDQGAPRGLARALSDHTVITAKEKGWDRLNNGALLQTAEEASGPSGGQPRFKPRETEIAYQQPQILCDLLDVGLLDVTKATQNR